MPRDLPVVAKGNRAFVIIPVVVSIYYYYLDSHSTGVEKETNG